MKLKIAAYVALAFLALDTVLKLTLPTPDWGWHPDEPGQRYAFLLAFTYVGFAMWVAPYCRLPAAIVLGGVLGNFLWTFNPGGVANPFVIEPYAFNAADIMVWVAVPITSGLMAWGLARRLSPAA